MPNDNVTINLQSELLSNAIVHPNLQQNIIVTTEDKAKLILLEHLEEVEDRKSWMTPAGILLSLGAIPLTSNFKDALLASHTWETICYVAILLDICWLLKCIYKAIRAVFFKKTTIESIINKMKKNENKEI